SVYPTLGAAAYDEPVVKRPKPASRSSAEVVSDAFAALPEAPPAIETPQTVASISPTMFNERFAAAAPQSVASNAVSATPQPETPKLAEAPKPVAASKLAEAKPVETLKPAESKAKPAPASQQVAMNVPPPPPKSSG